jgi:hypothetical protein
VRRTPDGWRVDGIGSRGAVNAAATGDSRPGDDQGTGEVLPDLVSAMVLGELLAGDGPRPRKPAVTGTPARAEGAATDRAGTAPRTGGPGTDAAAGTGSATTRRAGCGSAGTGYSGADCAEPRRGAGSGADSGRDGTVTTRLKRTIAQLEHALATRVRIEQAIGVLAERHRLAPRQAFDLLRQVARSSGSRVHDLAGEVVASATNPLLLLPAELARPPLQPHARGRSRRSREPG